MPSTAPRVRRIPLQDGDEYDALTGWRRVVHWKPGERKAIKQRYNRRLRARGRRSLRVEVQHA